MYEDSRAGVGVVTFSAFVIPGPARLRAGRRRYQQPTRFHENLSEPLLEYLSGGSWEREDLEMKESEGEHFPHNGQM